MTQKYLFYSKSINALAPSHGSLFHVCDLEATGQRQRDDVPMEPIAFQVSLLILI